MITLEKPQTEEVGRLLELYLSNYHNSIVDNAKRMEQLELALKGFSHSDVKTTINNAIKEAIIKRKAVLNSCDVLKEIYFHQYHNIENEDQFIRFLLKYGATHRKSMKVWIYRLEKFKAYPRKLRRNSIWIQINCQLNFFAPREIDELRIEGNGNSEKPKWVLEGDALVKRAEILQASLSDIETIMIERKQSASPVPFSFIAKIQEDATAKSKRKDITNFFQVKDNSSVIGVADVNELIVCLDSVDELRQISGKLRAYEKNDYAISCIEGFAEFEPSVMATDEVCNYKVKLVDYQDFEQNLAMRRMFEHTLERNKIEYKKTTYSEQFYVYNMKMVNTDMLEQLKKEEKIFNALFSVEPMPKYTVSLDFVDDDQEVPVKIPENGKNYLTIGILDNGIASIPNLKPWMEMDRWSPYPNDSINPTHGTFVAGVALYGDECEGKNWVGHKGIKLLMLQYFQIPQKRAWTRMNLSQILKKQLHFITKR